MTTTLPRRLVPAAAAALAASHAEYPSFRHVFPNPGGRRRALRAFFTATVRDGTQSGLVQAAWEGSRVLAVAVWLPPGAFPWSASRKLKAMPHLLRVLAAYPSRFPLFMRYGANAERSHPPGRHWYLVVAGVRPEAQRRGLGSRLITPGLATADEQGMPVCLETADRANIAYYERFGFTVTQDPLALVPGGPTHVAMRRPAQAL